MKRILYTIIAIFFVLVGVSFVLKNQEDVTVQYYFGLDWSGPLSILLLLFFSVGVLAGYLAGLAKIIQAKKETAKAREKVNEVGREVEKLRRLPIKDAI